MPRKEPAQSTVSPKPAALIHRQPKRRPPSPHRAAPPQMRRAVPRKPASLHMQPSRSAVERRRRNDMGAPLATLQALLPTALKKQGRRSHSAILTEAINYIAALQEQLAELARKKAVIVASEGASVTCADNGYSPDDGNPSTGKNDSSLLLLGSNKNSSIKRNGWSKVEVSPAERDIFITMSTSDIKGLLSEALLNVQKFNLDVLSACLSTNAQLGFLSIHCQLLNSADQLDIGKVRDELQQLVVGEGMKSGQNENCVDGCAEGSSTGVEGNDPVEQ